MTQKRVNEMKNKYIIFGIVSLVAFILGVIINDVPYFQIEHKIRPFEALTFFSITIFGYWFQYNQRKISTGSNVLLKLLEETIKELNKDLDSIILILEDHSKDEALELGDTEKKKIHLKLKNISFCMLFISEKTRCVEMKNKYTLIKDQIISEEFSTAKFCVTLAYLKDVNNTSNEFKKYIKDIVCKHIESL